MAKSRRKAFVKLYDDTKHLCNRIDALLLSHAFVFRFDQTFSNKNALEVAAPRLENTNVLPLSEEYIYEIVLPVLRSSRVQRAIAEEYKEKIKNELEDEQDSYRELLLRVNEPLAFGDRNEKDHG